MNQKIDIEKKVILITGAAGFIGYSVCLKLLKDYPQIIIVGFDNMNEYYDVSLKQYRLNELLTYKNFCFRKGNLESSEEVELVFKEYEPKIVLNLAAQAGVRYSITNPQSYIDSNIIGFFNILEKCRKYPVEHLVFASSSSVYGTNKKIPYSISDKVDNPVSLYAATKKSNELMAHAYAKLYDIPITGLRFFTVYGPAGRPDMAYFSFTQKLCDYEKIRVFNYGNCKRDFTYIDDIVEGVVKVMQKEPYDDKKDVKYRIYNIGNNEPENLLDFIQILYEELTKIGVLETDFNLEQYIELVPMQQGDVEITYADIDDLYNEFKFKPKTNLREGLKKFAEWYKAFYITTLTISLENRFNL